MYILKTSASFDSAHFLHGYNGKCANIHGHRWTIEVQIGSEQLQSDGDKRGMLIDFGDFKKEVKNLADRFDHALIYEENSLQAATVSALNAEHFNLIEVPFRPTAEHFSKYFYELLSKKLACPIKSVTVYETPENCAVYEQPTEVLA